MSFIFKYKSFLLLLQDDLKEESAVKCPKCKNTLWLIIDLLKVIDGTQLKIKLSITTHGMSGGSVSAPHP